MSATAQTGRYEILENLGRGATCRVDKARDTIIGRTVALKTFLQGFGEGSEEQLLTEAQTVGRLSHPSIAQLYDVGTGADGAPYLVMEYVSGKTVGQLLAHSPVPFAKAAVWAADIASALSYAHRAGVIHGDVTPSNIRVTIDDQVKLVDFGVARLVTQMPKADRVLGTPAYFSPEQILGQKQDGRSDLFSLGIVLYEMLTGFRPFSGRSLGEVCGQIVTAELIPPSKLSPAIPRAFDRILARCLAKNPKDRYQTGNQLARALYLVARCRSQFSAQQKTQHWTRRPVHRRDLLAAASVVLLVLSAMIAETTLRERGPSPVSPSVVSGRRVAAAPSAAMQGRMAAPGNPQNTSPNGKPSQLSRKSATHLK